MNDFFIMLPESQLHLEIPVFTHFESLIRFGVFKNDKYASLDVIFYNM